MGKRRRRKNKNRQKKRDQTQTLDPITEAQVGEVREWLDRMQNHVDKAISLSEQMDGNALSEDDYRFWALAKYAENVQECTVKLDNMKRSVLEALEEVPLKSEQGTDLTWVGMRDMRNELAHEFWDIDPKILWDRVTKDFPVLCTLLSLLVVTDKGADSNRRDLRCRYKRLPICHCPNRTPNSRWGIASSFCPLTQKGKQGACGSEN